MSLLNQWRVGCNPSLTVQKVWIGHLVVLGGLLCRYVTVLHTGCNAGVSHPLHLRNSRGLACMHRNYGVAACVNC